MYDEHYILQYHCITRTFLRGGGGGGEVRKICLPSTTYPPPPPPYNKKGPHFSKFADKGRKLPKFHIWGQSPRNESSVALGSIVVIAMYSVYVLKLTHLPHLRFFQKSTY